MHRRGKDSFLWNRKGASAHRTNYTLRFVVLQSCFFLKSFLRTTEMALASMISLSLLFIVGKHYLYIHLSVFYCSENQIHVHIHMSHLYFA